MANQKSAWASRRTTGRSSHSRCSRRGSRRSGRTRPTATAASGSRRARACRSRWTFGAPRSPLHPIKHRCALPLAPLPSALACAPPPRPPTPHAPSLPQPERVIAAAALTLLSDAAPLFLWPWAVPLFPRCLPPFFCRGGRTSCSGWWVRPLTTPTRCAASLVSHLLERARLPRCAGECRQRGRVCARA